jgi:hypothetical protein
MSRGGAISKIPVQRDNVVGSMVTPADTPDFGAIVLPVPIPLLYLGSLSAILGNQAFYRRKRRTFMSVDGRIDREGEQD